MPTERRGGQPGENHTKSIVGAFSKNSRRADEANESHNKKPRYGNVMETPSAEDIMTDDSAGSMDGDTVVSENHWRSFVSSYKPKIRMGSLDITPPKVDVTPAKDTKDFIKVHYKGTSDENEWALVIEQAKGFKKRLDIPSTSIKELMYSDKVLILTPTPELAKDLVAAHTESTGDQQVFLDPESSDGVLNHIVFNFHNADNGENFVRRIGERKSGEVSIRKISHDQASQYLQNAMNASLNRNQAIVQLAQSKPSQTHEGTSVVQEKCPDVLDMNVQILGVGQFQGKDEIVRISQHKKGIYIIPDKYMRPVAGVWVFAMQLEYYQLDVVHGLLYMVLKDNSNVDLATRLLSMAENKDLMDSNTKLRGSALRMLLAVDVNLTLVAEALDSIGVPSETLDTKDLDFAKQIFYGIRIPVREGSQNNMSVVKGPLDSSNSTMNKSKFHPPVKKPPQMMTAPTNARQPNGLIQPASFNLSLFDQAKNQPLPKRASITANPRSNKGRTVRVPYPTRQTKGGALKENNGSRMNQSTLPLSSRRSDSPDMTYFEGQTFSPGPSSSLFPKNNIVLNITRSGTKKVTKLIIDVRYLPAPLQKSILDAMIERMEQRKASNTPRQVRSRNAITAATENETVIANGTAASADPVCIDLSDDDEPNSSGSADVPSNAFIAECPDGAHEIFRNLHVLEPVKLGNGQMCANDVFHLAKGQQLGDGVVEFILEFHRMSMPKNSGIHVFSYFFFQSYQNLVGREKQPFVSMSDVMHKRLSDYTKKVDLFECRYLVIPILKDQHWFLAIVCAPNPLSDVRSEQKPCIAILDSLVGSGVNPRHKETFALIQHWLEKEYEIKTGQKHSFGSKVYPQMVVAIPQQQNGVDCGIFMLTACQYFLEDKPVFYPKKNLKPQNVDQDFSGRNPKVPKWFGSSSVCVQKMRLQFLDWYYSIAAWKKYFVYRDGYIRSLIKEVGKENDLLAAEFAEPPKSPSGSDTESQPSPKISENNQPQPGPSTPVVKPDPVKLYQDVQMLDRHNLLKPADKVFYARAGYLPTEGQLQQKTYTAAEKLKIILERKAEKKAKEMAAQQAVERPQTAQEMYDDFMKSS